MIFIPTLFIDADTISFSFSYSHGNKALTLATFLYVSAAEPPVILAVGNQPPTTVGGRRVELFHLPLQPLNYSEYLEAFLRHAAVSVPSGWRKIIRPRFHFRISRRLAEWVGGYYDGVFRSAALQAGATTSNRVVIEVA